MYLTEQQAWQLSEFCNYSDVADYAMKHDLTFAQAAAKLWEELWLTRHVFSHAQ